MTEVCRSCKAPIRWAISEHGRPIPLDLDPHPDGNVWLAGARVPGGTPRAIVVPEDRRPGLAGELYMPHWATCPDAAEHRRR